MSIAIYPGSFDPITNGHLNIIARAAKSFDQLIVCVMVNGDKHPMFSLEERVEMIRRVTQDMENVEVDSSDALLADYARRRNARVIIKACAPCRTSSESFRWRLSTTSSTRDWIPCF